MGSHGNIFDAGSHPDRVDAAIAAIAQRQHGNVTFEQLRGIGLSDGQIKYRVRLGRLFRVHPGVYAVGRPPTTALERASAAVLACGPGAALSHGSAASLWGFQDGWRTPVHVTVPGDRRPQRIVTHRATSLIGRDAFTQRGIRATSPARTFLDWAPLLTPKRLARAVNDARLRGALRLHRLADALERFPRHPGARLLRPFVANPERRPTRSELEDAFLRFCVAHDLPTPQVNVHVCGREVDAYFPKQRLIAELDSWLFHGDRRSFERDRDNDAMALASGIATVRVTWERMTETPAEEAERLRTIVRSRTEP